MELYLCRHCETEWTRSGRHTSHTDLPLTEAGKKQAILLGKRLALIQLDDVFSSPMQRAIASCGIPRVQPTIDADLSEWNYGDYEGLKHDEIMQKDPHWNLFDNGAPNGESLQEVSLRADRFLKKISRKQGKIAIFSHGHFSRVLAARWLGLDIRSARYFILGVASLSILGFEREQHVVMLWNDTHHLDTMRLSAK